MTTDRFTKRPKTQNINISLDHCKKNLKFTSKKSVFDVSQGFLQDTSRSPWGPQTSVQDPPCHICDLEHLDILTLLLPDLSLDPKRTPWDPRKPFGH